MEPSDLPKTLSRILPGLIPLIPLVLIIYLHLALPGKLSPGLVYEPDFLLFLLNTLFIFLSSFAVAALAGLGFIGSGNLILLTLGSGALATGLASAISGWVLPSSGGNLAVTVHNCGALLAGTLHFAGAVLAASALGGKHRRRRLYLLLAYAAVLAMLLSIILFFDGFLPDFFIPRGGPTPVRQFVLVAAALLFACSGFIFLGIYHRTRTAPFYWYSLALRLYAVGLLGVLLLREVGDPLNWVGRSAQYLAGVFFFMAVTSAFKGVQNRKILWDEILSEVFRRPDELYTTLVKTTSDAVIVLDRGERVLLWNAAAELMFGFAADEARGARLFDLVVPGEGALALSEAIRMSPEDPRFAVRRKIDFEVKPKRGEPFPVEASVSRARISGQPICTLILRDTTERRRAQEALLESEERYRSIFENSLDGIFLAIPKEGRIVAANPVACTMHGYTEDEIRRLGRSGVVDTTDPGFQKSLEERARLGHAFGVYNHVRKDGSLFPCEVSTVTFKDKHGRVSSVVISRDITERVQAQEGLKKAKEELEIRVQERTAELESRNQELQEFAFVASHDLNEPLRKIQVFSKLVLSRKQNQLDEESRDYLTRMEGAANRMQKLLDALLSYSRITTHGREFVPVDLNHVVRDAEADLELAIRKSGARLETSDLPTVKGDPEQLRQLFQNLIANALKYRRKGFEPLVRIRAERNGKSHRIYVEDNGIGMEEKYLEKIFLPFQRLHGRTEYEGIGMGLAICRKIVERHKGGIRATSRPGDGSTFIVTLPPEQVEQRDLSEPPQGDTKSKSVQEAAVPAKMASPFVERDPVGFDRLYPLLPEPADPPASPRPLGH